MKHVKLKIPMNKVGDLDAKDHIISTKKELKEGVKYDQNKAPLYLISTYAADELARVLEFGKNKYAAWNWSKGIEYSRVISAAKRHIQKWEEREDIDEESNANHLACAMCNLMFLLDYEARELKHLDDRRPVESLKSKKRKKS